MQNSASALSQLRLATRELHESLDSLLPVARLDADQADYDHYLQDLWGWMRAFEDRLWQAPWPDEIEARARTGKLAWIESDLRSLHPGIRLAETLPASGFDPDLGCEAARFGLAYVVEGAQLGTRVLARRLAPQLGTWTPRWLQGYGERNAQLWRQFIDCAERRLDSEIARRRAARAAVEAFESLHEWFAAAIERRAAETRANLTGNSMQGWKR